MAAASFGQKGRKTLARAKNTKTREKIRKVAIQLFSEKGYVNTSFSDIAKACGVERTID